MVDVLQDKREAIAELCARHGVARLDAFGSALRALLGTDVDLLMAAAVRNRYVAREIERTKLLLSVV